MSNPITISCYWNPCKWETRRANYERFRNQLGTIPHASIHLGEALADANMIVQSQSWLWHKERLLNVLAARLVAKGHDKIIWLDADIEFLDPRWFDKCVDALDEYPVVQPFKQYVRENEPGTHAGAVYHYIKSGMMPSRGSGFACGINANIWKQHGLYELGLIGGGDVMFLQACVHPNIRQLRMNPFFPRNKVFMHDYLEWAKQLFESVKNNVWCCDGEIQAFWHGTIPNRKYTRRHPVLTKFQLNDLTINEHNMFEWATPNGQEIGDYIERYMFDRKEDECTQTSLTQ